VYSFGYNFWGDLGIGPTENQNTPQKIYFQNGEKIEKIFTSCMCYGCFFYSSFYFFYYFLLFYFLIFLFLEKKKLFSCGLNESNQKGIFNESLKLDFPTKIDFFKDIEIDEVFPGYSSTFVKTKSFFFYF
jgi:hypothetical protein